MKSAQCTVKIFSLDIVLFSSFFAWHLLDCSSLTERLGTHTHTWLGSGRMHNLCDTMQTDYHLWAWYLLLPDDTHTQHKLSFVICIFIFALFLLLLLLFSFPLLNTFSSNSLIAQTCIRHTHTHTACFSSLFL